jgi:hypothetical protein
MTVARRRHRPQRGDGLFRARLLHEAQRRVEQHDRDDREGVVRHRLVALDEPERQRDRRRRDEQQDEHALELREEPPPRGNRRLGGQLVRSVAREAPPCLDVGEPARAVGAERREHCAHGACVPEPFR